MFSETTFLLVFGLGAICMLLGFFLVLRGVGAADSESSIKLIGIEIRASKVGPGILFALFGLVLIVTALSKQPGPDAPARTEIAKGPAETTPPQPEPPAGGPAAKETAEVALEKPPAEEPTEPEPASTVTPLSNTPARHTREAQLLRQFLAEAAQGGCNPQILGPAPLADCQRSIGMMQPQLMAAGPVVNVAYLTSAQTPYGVADRFVVQHSVGTTATWTGILGTDGRFLTLVSP